MMTTRSASAIASSRSWVTNSTALRSAFHRVQQQIAHDLPGLGVERAERLVHQQDLRVADQDLRRALLACAGRRTACADSGWRKRRARREVSQPCARCSACARGAPFISRPMATLSIAVFQGNSASA